MAGCKKFFVKLKLRPVLGVAPKQNKFEKKSFFQFLGNVVFTRSKTIASDRYEYHKSQHAPVVCACVLSVMKGSIKAL